MKVRSGKVWLTENTHVSFASAALSAGSGPDRPGPVCRSARAQPREELINRILKDLQGRSKVEAKAGDSELRKLLIERYHVALEEVQDRCDDFKKGLNTLDTVVQSCRNLLTAELEMRTDPREKILALERVIDIVRWYEGELERGLKAGVGLRADMLHARQSRLSFEIQVLRLKQEMGTTPK